MPRGTPFSVTGALLLLFLGVLTALWPLRSVTLFTLLAPFADYEPLLGWDVRIYWGLMLGARALWDRVYGRKRRTLISGKAALFWLLFCLVGACVLYVGSSGLTAQDTFGALSVLVYFVVGSMFLFAVIQFVTTDQQMKPVLWGFAGAALAVSLYAAWQALTTYGAGSSARVVATLGNPNYLATNLALASTSLLLLARRLRGWSGVFFFLCAVAALLGTVLTLSRVGVASALVGWVLVCVTRRDRIEYRKVVLMLAIVAVAASAGVGAYLFDYRQEVTFSADPNLADLADATQAAEDLSRLEAALYAAT